MRSEALFLGLLLVLISIPTMALSGSGETVAVQHVESPVKFRPPDQTFWQELSDTTANLPDSGDLLVEEDGAIEVQGNQSRLSLNEKSGMTFQFNQNKEDSVRLNHGSMKSEVQSEHNGPKKKPTEKKNGETKLKIETPKGSLGVRGTEFGVSFERSGRSEVYVDTGLVGLSTDRDQTRVSGDQYVAFGQRGVKPVDRILDRGGLPDRYQITWGRWRLKKTIRQLKEKRRKLQNQVKDNHGTLEDAPESLQDELRNVEKRLKEAKGKFKPFEQQYRDYRKRLEKQRGDFIRKRKQAFDEFRRQRMKEMNLMKQQRQQGIEEMRRRQQEGMGN